MTAEPRFVRCLMVAALTLGVAGLLAWPANAHAVIVCQKKKTVRLRPGPTCKKKEQKVADLGILAGADRVGATAGALEARLQTLDAVLGLQCEGAPAKTFVGTTVAGVPPVRTDGCRALGSNQAACEAAFERSGHTAVSCVFYKGRCLPCGGALLPAAVCMNACRPFQCPGAPSRTYRGDQFFHACESQKSQADCEASFEVDGPVSSGCRWIAAQSRCQGCYPSDEDAGTCANACGSPSRPQCASRPGPATLCSSVTTQTACERAWESFTDNGHAFAQPCRWNTIACTRCDASSEFAYRLCKNDC